ncbi:MAG: DpnII family type II restriction endonuclease [Alkalispirochaeta sp.]
MKKVIQEPEELLGSLSILETDWKDEFTRRVLLVLENIGDDPTIDHQRLIDLLEQDFEAATTIIRLFLEMSKDEYIGVLRGLFKDSGDGSSGRKRFLEDPEQYVKTLDHLLIRQRISETVSRHYTWRDIIAERFKGGRGSAIKGQKRGRDLEDFVEKIVRDIFPAYSIRGRFSGLNGLSTEKADFAIPSNEDPQIIIEVKGYGATGSKQTDVIGDINRIIHEKRHDTVFLLFTDGISWRARKSDFRKLVEFQNRGYIYRIYTKSMIEAFREDLIALRNERNA